MNMNNDDQDVQYIETTQKPKTAVKRKWWDVQSTSTWSVFGKLQKYKAVDCESVKTLGDVRDIISTHNIMRHEREGFINGAKRSRRDANDHALQAIKNMRLTENMSEKVICPSDNSVIEQSQSQLLQLPSVVLSNIMKRLSWRDICNTQSWQMFVTKYQDAQARRELHKMINNALIGSPYSCYLHETCFEYETLLDDDWDRYEQYLELDTIIVLKYLCLRMSKFRALVNCVKSRLSDKDLETCDKFQLNRSVVYLRLCKEFMNATQTVRQVTVMRKFK